MSAPAAMMPLNDLRAIGGIQAQALSGTGKGVIVAVLDEGVDTSHPALRAALLAQRDFTGQGTTDDTADVAGHGTGIAAILVGRDPKTYLGLAPDAKLINARVSNTGDVATNMSAGEGLLWAVKSGAKVINFSYGDAYNEGSLTYKFSLMTDYVAERYGASIAVAGGNDRRSAINQNPGGAYNLFTVGSTGSRRYNQVLERSNFALPNDGRTKPDLVAPGEKIGIATSDWEKDTNYWEGTGTSYAAPMVGGVVAQLMSYGRKRELSTSPQLMKAILMTSATKIYDPNWTRWSPREGDVDEDYGWLWTKPLDDHQGAGRVDAVAAYKLYAKKKDAWTPLNTWREGKLKENQTFSLKIGKLIKGQRLDATLTWLRHVSYKDTDDDGDMEPEDQFYQTASLADFTLTLLRNGIPIAGSDSDVDNVEHLAWSITRGGEYSLEVYRFDGIGIATEPFALAARVLNPSREVMRASLRASETPEPGGVGLVAVVLVLVGARQRRG
jgi:subtilisin family serine protease